MRPARILHLHSTFDLGGKEARAVRLMNHFGKQAEHVVLSAMPDQMSARDVIDKRVKVEFPTDAPLLAGKPSAKRYSEFAHYMKKFDLLLSYNWGSMDAVMAHTIFANSFELPPLVHHEDGFNSDEIHKLKLKRNIFRMIGLAKASALVVPSERLEQIALKTWKQPSTKVLRIPNGIPMKDYSKRPQRGALPGFEKRPGEVVVGTVAGLRTVKNLPRLVRAVAAAGDNIRLIIVGEGPEKDAIEAAASKAGITDRVLLTGFLSNPARYIGLFDIFALSSDSEQFPISLVEAMAAGLPIAATDVGDIKNMVSRANHPYIVGVGDDVALSDAIRLLAEQAEGPAVIGQANQAKAQAEFNEKKMLSRYGLLYGNLLHRPDFGQ